MPTFAYAGGTPNFNESAGGGTLDPRRRRRLPGQQDLAPIGAPVPTRDGFPTATAQPQLQTQFGPGNNLINQQINPVGSQRLGAIGGQVDQARNAVAGFRPTQFQGVTPGTAPGSIGAGVFAPSADTTAARGAISQQLGSLQNLPDRGQLASEAFNLIQERGAPQYQSELRDVGRRAAALGRIGAGVTTNELTDVFSQRQRDLDLARRGLANEAAGQTLADRLGILGATQGVAGQLYGQDVTGAGVQQGLRQEARGERGQLFDIGQALRGEARGERGAEQGYNLANLGAQQSILGQLGGLEAQQQGQERANREELRGERGFQTALDQQGIQNAIQQRLLEEQLLQGQFGRDFSIQQLLGQIGYNPASTANFQQGAQFGANQYGNQAGLSSDAAAALIGSLAGRGTLPQQQQLPPGIGTTNLSDFRLR